MQNKKLILNRNIQNIQTILSEQIASSFSSTDGVYTKKIAVGSYKITIYVAENYYYRTNSTLSLTLILEEKENEITAEVIASGGKTGLFGFTYGTEKSALNKMVDILLEYGFVQINEDN